MMLLDQLLIGLLKTRGEPHGETMATFGLRLPMETEFVELTWKTITQLLENIIHSTE